jgi:hypothetical protein
LLKHPPASLNFSARNPAPDESRRDGKPGVETATVADRGREGPPHHLFRMARRLPWYPRYFLSVPIRAVFISSFMFFGSAEE